MDGLVSRSTKLCGLEATNANSDCKSVKARKQDTSSVKWETTRFIVAT